ncbi:MAG TPA: AGE family epimerase/isomerase [Puia sp.]|nr:AGE family epimerase/isomerase [Puia sp.]
MNLDLKKYKDELDEELHDILSFWINHTIDNSNGGFFGEVDNSNKAQSESPKGSVLNSRILWAFSAAFRYTKKNEYYAVAERAYKYIIQHFIDKQYGGVYWSVDCKGNLLNGRKQMYALAFCVYSLSEFHKIRPHDSALNYAIEIFRIIEQYSYDKKQKGYIEAFDMNWKPLADFRLSKKDANEKKTMNSHLHIIEAYANLYEIWPENFLKSKIENLLEVFDHYIIDKDRHLCLFFDEHWNPKSKIISYGHDIEAAWLLQQCAEKINHYEWVRKMKENAILITESAMEGLDHDGGLWCEFNSNNKTLLAEKHWWPQAEAMVGFMNAYEISKDGKYLELSYKSWQFVKRYIKDNNNGEWFWGINADYSVMQNQDKAGFWKCPYHNTRACLELVKRTDRLAHAPKKYPN